MTRTRWKTLLVEADADDVRPVWSAMKQAGIEDSQVQRADGLAAACECLGNGRFDMVLMDGDLFTGKETLAEIRRVSATVPVVLLIDRGKQSAATDLIGDGIADFLCKDELSADNLQRLLRYTSRLGQLRARWQDANESLLRKNRRLARFQETAYQFVDHVSHEFRTPLTVIKEFASIMHDGLAGEVNDQQREFLRIVNDRADDLAIIVDDMLDVGKLESGLLSLWRKPSRIEDVFAEVLPALRRKAAIKNIALESSIDADLPRVFCDGEKVGRVIVNLVVNAIKFSGDDGSVRLWARHDGEGADVVVGISDDGPGIAPEDLKPIFDRFHQLDSATRGSTKGFGLGLTVAKELVHHHFGDIDVESRLGRGSTFSFTVPAWDPSELAVRCLRRIERVPETSGHAALIAAQLDSPTDSAVCNVVDEFLQHSFRRTSLVVPVPPDRWAIVTDCDAAEDIAERLDRVRESWEEINRGRSAVRPPQLRLRAEGTWSVAAQKDEILDRFRRQLATEERPAKELRILVADDDREMLRGLELRLRSSGYEVLTAADGESAVRMAVRHLPDAILMDNYMPGMDGVDALSRLADMPDTRPIPVIILSASGRDRKKALDGGARFFLQKPCDIGTISAALQQVVRQPVGV